MPTPTEQLLSRTSYAGDGVTTAWNFTFASGYIDQAHVKAFVLDSLGARTDLTVVPGDFIGEFQLSVTPPVAVGSTLTIYRDTPKDAPIVDFADGGNLTEAALDTLAKQAIFCAAESEDALNTEVNPATLDALNAAEAAAAIATAAAASTSAVEDFIHAATSKTPVVDADELAVVDSADGFSLKKLTWANLKAVLQTTLMFLASGVGAVYRTILDKLREEVSVKDFGAVGDGVTDDTAAIQAALTAVGASGGVLFFPPAVYLYNTTLMLPSNVTLCGYGATLNWGGGATTAIDTASTGVTTRVGFVGFTLNGGSASTILALRSVYQPLLKDITFTSASATNTCLLLSVNTSGTNHAGTLNRNCVFGTFDNITQNGTCGTFISLSGANVTDGVVTLNTFSGLNAVSCAVYGIDFAKWVDSNYFAGVTRINLAADTASVGVIWNSDAPTVNNGVYANNFDHLAVDTFGSGAARIGIKFTFTKANKIDYYFQDPVAGGGSIVATSDCLSYDVMHQIGGANTLVHKVLGNSTTIGAVGGSSTWSIGGEGFKAINYSFDAASSYTYSTGVFYIGTTVAQPIIFAPNNAEKFRVDGTGVVTQGGSVTAPAMKVIPVSAQTSWVEVRGSNTAAPSIGASSGTLTLSGTVQTPGNSSFGKTTVPTCAVDTTSEATSLVTNTAATYTVLTTDSTIIQTTTASVYTLPAAASFTGRKLHLLTQFAGTVTSASSNVVPIAGGAAGTAILAATAGKYALLQSNGTNWVIVAAN